MQHHITEKGLKDSDRYSNTSDLKNDRDHDYSETYSATDSTATRLANYISNGSNGGSGVPLAGPVKIPNDQRYSGDYTDMMATKIGLTNNGYIPYGGSDYTSPQSLTQIRNSTSLKNHLLPSSSALSNNTISPSITTSATSYMNGQVPIDHYSLARSRELRQDNGLPSIPMSTMPNGLLSELNYFYSSFHCPEYLRKFVFLDQSLLNNVDVRYSATYGNPYLKQNNNSSLPYVPTANPAVTPAPPPYNANRSTNSNSSFSSSTTISNNGSLLNAGVNVGVNYGNSNPNIVGLSVSSTSAPPTSTTQTTQITSPTRQFIIPANGDIKKGALATHV